MKCKHCGSELTSTMKFCAECGQLVERLKPKKFCTRCGNKLHDGLHFCPQCGTRIELSEATAATPRTEQPQTSVPKAESKVQPEKYKVVFRRKSQFSAYSVYAVQIQADQGGATYQLKNGSSLEFAVSPGHHIFQLKMSAAAMNLRTTEISLDVRSNRELEVSTISVASVAMKPIIVKDEIGAKL